MKKKMKKPKNPVAAKLIGRQFQNRVIRDKTKYSRKDKHKGGATNPRLHSFPLIVRYF